MSNPIVKRSSFREISVGRGSPGQLFKLPETDIRARLESIRDDSGGLFSYRESASLQQLVRVGEAGDDLLVRVYGAKNDVRIRHAHC